MPQQPVLHGLLVAFSPIKRLVWTSPHTNTLITPNPSPSVESARENNARKNGLPNGTRCISSGRLNNKGWYQKGLEQHLKQMPLVPRSTEKEGGGTIRPDEDILAKNPPRTWKD